VNKLNWLNRLCEATDNGLSPFRPAIALVYGPVYCQQVSNVKIVRVSPSTPVFNEAVIAAGKGYRCEKNPESYIGEVQFSFKTTANDDE
jgi:hypothetical protein